MSEVGVKRRRRSGAEVEALVAEYEASGLKRGAFCRQRGLAVGTLDKYRRRVHGRRHSGEQGFCFLSKWFPPRSAMSARRRRVRWCSVSRVAKRAPNRSTPWIRCGNAGAPADRIGRGVEGVRVWTGDADLCCIRLDGHAEKFQWSVRLGTRSSELRSGKWSCVCFHECASQSPEAARV
jgi:hypothetical protein